MLLYSDDLDATVAAVESAGGRVLEGPYEFPGGRRFHFADPAATSWASGPHRDRSVIDPATVRATVAG